VDKSVSVVAPFEVYAIESDEEESESESESEEFDDEDFGDEEDDGEVDYQEEYAQEVPRAPGGIMSTILQSLSNLRWWAKDNVENNKQHDKYDDEEYEEPTELKKEDFPSFAVMENVSEHHFLHQSRVPNRAFSKRMVTEWEILKKSLPGGVYVRAFENRLDLLKVMIIGPAGTPYEDGVFVLDVYLPPDYPQMVPQVYYRSVGSQLNPNLHKDGTVCLSLLGTWSGKGVEAWQPHASNILQVVVSIQGLILGTPHPYYLEAGYDKFRDTSAGLHHSRLYNETVFLLTVQAMILYMKNHPYPFEELVRNHFIQRADAIVNRCNSYLKSPDEETEDDSSKFIVNASLGFRQSLAAECIKLQKAVQVLKS